MNQIVEKTSSQELLANMDANLAAFYSAYGRAEGSTCTATKSVVWFYTGIQDSLFNGVLCARLKPDEVKPVVDALQTKINAYAAPALWWVSPESKPDDLGSLLEDFGLQLEGEIPGMAMDLNLLEDKPDPIPNFMIRKVNGADLQALWARIASVGNGLAGDAADSLIKVETTLADPYYRAQHRYIGFLDGKPVATSAMVLDSGLAGIYGVATIPEGRHKGIGRLMTVMPLLEANEMGYRVGILQASSMGYPLYLQIGFKDVCRYKLWLQSM